jgi:hypothetical protein
MKNVILKGGGKKILDVDHVIFFYMETKKDIKHVKLQSDKNFKEIGLPSMYINLRSSNNGDQYDLVFPVPKGDFNDMMKNIVSDYKKNKISFNKHTEILDNFLSIFVTSHLKNGIFRGTDIKVNLLKKTKLSFVNAVAKTDEDKEKYFIRINTEQNYKIESKTITVKKK